MRNWWMLGAACGWLLLATARPAVAQPANPLTEVRFQRDLSAGRKACGQGDFGAAEKAYRAAVAARPDSSEAHNNLGEALFRANRFPEAAAEFQKAYEVGDTAGRARAAYNMGNSLVRQDRLAEAAEAYQRALRHDERDADARYNLHVVEEKLKKLKDQQKKKDQKKGQDQKSQGKQQKSRDPKDKKQESSPGKQDKKQQSKEPQDKKQQGQQDKKQQAKGDQGQGQKGKGSQGQDQKTRGESKTPGRAAAQRPRQQQQRAQAARPPQGVPGQAQSKQDAERLLRYFQEKERAGMARNRQAPARQLPAYGTETW